jgi:Skp family chaperone for outer membrane proteins
MKGFAVAAALALVLSGAPLFAQTPAAPAGQKPPAPAPAGQTTTPPAGQPPAAQPPAPQPPPAQTAKPPAPFPQGAKVAYVNLQLIAQTSREGQAANAKAADFTKKKQAEIAEKQKQLQGNQQKLQTGGTVLSDAARAQLEKDIERQGRELERLQQDAQADFDMLNRDLQAEFNKKLFPILEQISNEHQLHFLFSAADAGLIWAAEGLDLSLEAVKRLDSASTGAAAKPPAPTTKP